MVSSASALAKFDAGYPVPYLENKTWAEGDGYKKRALYIVRRMQSRILGDLRQFAIRNHFVPQETHVRTRGARLVCPLGCAAFGDQRKLAPPCRNFLNTALAVWGHHLWGVVDQNPLPHPN